MNFLWILTPPEGAGGFAGFCWGAEEGAVGGGALCVVGAIKEITVI